MESNGIKPLIVLDLDGVLILRRDKRIYKRKGLNDFLDYLAERYYIGIYTSITEVNLKTILKVKPFDGFNRFSFILSRKDTNKDPEPINEWDTIKNISKIREEFPRFNKILLLDDSPRKVRFNKPEEVLIVKKYADYVENYDLKELIPLIEKKLN